MPPEPPPWYRWHPVISWPVGGCAFGVLALRLLPDLPLGHTLFDLLKLHLTWPFLILGLAYIFWRIGAARQVRTGEPTFAPGQATAAGVVVLLTVFFLLGVWGASWPLWWWAVVLAVLAAAAVALAVGWFAYSEAWRTAFHPAVMRSVERQIRRAPDRFIRETTRRRDRRAAEVAALDWFGKKAKAAPGRAARVLGWVERRARRWVAGYDHAWGSPHARAVLEGNFVDARHALIRAAEQLDPGFDDDALLDDFVSAGECLVAYLQLDWSEGEADGANRQRWEVYHELIAATVAFAAPPRSSEFGRALLARIPDWLAGFRAACEPEDGGFGELFELIVLRFSTVGRVRDADEDEVTAEREWVSRVMVEFHRLPDDAERARFAEVWLALASRADATVRRDVWAAMTDALPEPPTTPGGLLPTLARGSLAAVLAEIEQRTPGRWRTGVSGAARTAAERVPAAQPDAVRKVLEGR